MKNKIGNLNNPILMLVSFIQTEIDNNKYNEDSPTIFEFNIFLCLDILLNIY